MFHKYDFFRNFRFLSTRKSRVRNETIFENFSDWLILWCSLIEMTGCDDWRVDWCSNPIGLVQIWWWWWLCGRLVSRCNIDTVPAVIVSICATKHLVEQQTKLIPLSSSTTNTKRKRYSTPLLYDKNDIFHTAKNLKPIKKKASLNRSSKPNSNQSQTGKITKIK